MKYFLWVIYRFRVFRILNGQYGFFFTEAWSHSSDFKEVFKECCAYGDKPDPHGDVDEYMSYWRE